MSKAGRPPIEIKQEDFEKLCGLQCPLEEIASWFKCSADTIERWCKKIYGMNFAEVYKKHSASGKISLRRYQFNLAKTNASMAIWLGKQMLGQREPIDTESTGADRDIHVTLSVEDMSGGEDGD